MISLVDVLPSVFLLLAAVSLESPAGAGQAAVTVTETPPRVTLENGAVKFVFDATTNYVPCELISKRGSGQNLIVNNFCL